MKKIALCMFLCIGVLNGMEPEQRSKDVCLSNLPEEVYNEIIETALATSSNLSQAIKALKVASVLRGVCYDNLKDFTRIVHILADKFNVTTQEVALRFDTSLAKEYRWNSYLLLCFIDKDQSQSVSKDDIIDMIINNIQKGADINFSFVGRIGDFNDEIFLRASPLSLAIIHSNFVMVETFLEFGATVTRKVLSLAQRMITFTDANITLNQRVHLIDNDKNLRLESIDHYIERVLRRTKKENYTAKNADAVKIYELLLKTMNK